MRTTQQTKSYRARISPLLVLCLLISLLFTQFLGLAHSIVHAQPDGVVLMASMDAASPDGKATRQLLHDTSTSCAAFDEACVGASLLTPAYLPPLLPGAAVLSLWSAFASWEQPFQHFFSSRAPPA